MSDADRIVAASNNLAFLYVGARSVNSDQVLVFQNASDVESKEDQAALCNSMDDYYQEYVLGYDILDVNCIGFKFVPNDSRQRRLREMDDQHSGRIYLELTVTGQISSMG